MKKKIYVETSIVSYLTGRPTNNLQAAAAQKMTLDWWSQRRGRFELYTSGVVLEEASRGDAEAAQRRLAVLADLPALHTSSRAS